MSTIEIVQRPSKPMAAAYVALAVVVAAIGNAVVAVVGHAAGASAQFRPLEPGTFLPLTVIGVLLGALGWSLIGRGRRGASTLRWLVPLVVVVSWVPDVLLGIMQNQPNTTWTGVVALMAMHLVVAGVAVPTYFRALPVHDQP